MTSTTTFSPSRNGAAAHGEYIGEILHFDATVRRKEKMRLQAERTADGRVIDGRVIDGRAGQVGETKPAAVVPAGNGRHATRPANGSPPAAAPSTPAMPAARAAVTAPVPVRIVPATTSADVRAGGNGAPAAASSPSAAGRPSGAEMESFLVDFVVEQTGYPREMVELDADLEADLGIDSIKKAQLFGELAEHFGVQATGHENLSLDDFPTLRHVVRFLETAETQQTPAESRPAAAAVELARASVAPPQVVAGPSPAVPASAPAASPAASAKLPTGPELERFLIGFVVEQTGYPEDMVELDADLEADLGIDSIKKAQLFGELAEQFEIRAADAGDLSLDDFPTLRHVLSFLEGAANCEAAGGEAARAPERPPSGSPAPPNTAARPGSNGSTAHVAVSAAPPAPRVSELQRFEQEVPSAFGEPDEGAAADAAVMSPDELEQFLVNFVIEQTGYPAEMVELDADLEADLGIDSIKKAQLFGELAEHFEVSTADAADLSLDDFPTLRHVLNFLVGAPRKMTV